LKFLLRICGEHGRNFKLAALMAERPWCAHWRGRIDGLENKQRENKTCRLLGAARGKHFMRVAIRVNGSFRKSPVSPKDRSASVKMVEHVDALTRTLAPESRHIVASQASDTTSRAVVIAPLSRQCSA
jgi:hypothetical protein